MKKVEKIPVARSPRMAAEPVSVRKRKIRSGMIGFANLDSKKMKPTNSATAAARKPSVCGEPQPSLDAVTMP